MTELYLSDITRYDGRIEKLEDGLPKSVLEHCGKHQSEKERQASLLGWNILLMILKHHKIEYEGFVVNYNEYGKPSFGNQQFNISYDGEIVAVAISTSEVGISIKKTDDDHNNIIQDYFSKSEKEQYSSSDGKAKAFTELWTRKLAFHKHVGDGIRKENIKNDIPYKEILTTYLEDKNKQGYYLSVDCIDNEKVHFKII